MAQQQTQQRPVQSCSGTDQGRMRDHNEDNYLDFDRWQREGRPPIPTVAKKGQLWVVADGMGGHAGGQQASHIVVNKMMETYYQDTTLDPSQSLINAIHYSNKVVYHYAQEHPEFKGMGSTVVAVVLHNGYLHTAWVGDSRAYLLRQGHLTPLTTDHSWVQMAVKQGTITPEEAENHPQRNVVLRSVGAKPETEPEVLPPLRVQQRDIFLLCTDGLTGVVRDGEIQQILQTSTSPQEAVRRLIDQANAGGGPDNITASVISLGAYSHKPVAAAASPGSNLPWLAAGGVVVMALILFLVVFTSSPSSPRPPTPAPTESPTTAPIGAAGAVTPTATLTPTATSTLTTDATPTDAAAGAATPTKQPTTATISPVASPSPIATTTTTYAAPILLAPKSLAEENTTHITNQQIEFKWRWPGGQLPDGLGFEIKVWVKGKDPKGIYDAKEMRKGLAPAGPGKDEYSFAYAGLGDAPGVRDGGTSNQYLWSVSLVQLEPYQVLAESEHRPINIAYPGKGGPDAPPSDGAVVN